MTDRPPSPRILIVDDSEADCLLLVNDLRRGNVEPAYERVETAEVMRAALAREEWDVILTDQSMPRFSAAGALEVLRESGRDIPLILVSGRIDVNVAVRLLKEGFQDYIDKNDLTRLVPAVKRELRQAEDRRQRRQAEQQLRLLGTAVSAVANAIFITDSQGVIQWTNAAFGRLSGYTAEDLTGKTPRILKSGAHPASYYEELWRTILAGQVWAGEVVERRKDGSLFTVQQTITPLLRDDGTVSHFVAIHEDITRRKEAEAKVEYLAYHDSLTDLPNRALFLDRLTQALNLARRSDRLVALHFLDLDQFKVVNDTMGHAGGDALLRAVADRLKRSLRQTDTIARLGGDEFAIIQPNLASVDEATRLADRLQAIFSAPFPLCGQDIQTTVSNGITLFPLDDPSGDRLVENADMAMYLAKAEGRNRFAFYSESLNAQTRARRELEAGLNVAIAEGQLVVHYQPQVDLSSGALIGMEALVRWQHPTRGLLFPGSFLPVAEASGLIVPLSDFVLRKGCDQTRAWQQAYAFTWQLAVNVSAEHFRNAQLLQSVREALAGTGMEPRYLELELTESTLINDEQSASATMRELRRLGVHFAVDDFGTGYSSLRYLKQLPVERLKIDQSFVRNLPHDPDDAAIVRAIIRLGHELGLRVIAEGVETADHVAFLKEHGCDEGQGYYFYRPMPPEGVESLLGNLKPLETACRDDRGC